ncbi:aspartyl/asparaginyl beta-hydroxylase domain-containing protein [Luteimonas fraxinea]|uniref:Aspartyl/asparaginyl beta-hydroxylase domain-containing protein n=1 Tax=Luteimonas fraxinea TaxID=2901869 RepID=A0ABS8UEW0_9GAMM|nr:aspartyl/asparaginyl beta-hydroxylase domain-containing protein [Luteimonas fraxinea]MCD9098037.1 aspartyl/asparaginyl beta-hydroxylase domain-containing protein [Luteimonas fraxinea]UHH09238.1 aspartyl/asparaginyl beta-hydroxylase domain-containing protein [Luteimonas fraxinea]
MSQPFFYSGPDCVISYISDEVVTLWRKTVDDNRQGNCDLTALGGKWACSYLKRSFSWVEAACNQFETTNAFLRSQRVAKEAMFSRLDPGTHIELHSDYANYVTTVHLPLVSADALIEVGGEGREYEDGVPICLDSTFMHQVRCPGTIPRDVLLYNVWHPDLSDDEIWAIEFIRASWWPGVSFDPDLGP